ncbi:hypothetical protein Lal_00012683 [Lupinus albus]|nr:hypothetical protein Lal_00012683 [Lupinus albus]
MLIKLDRTGRFDRKTGETDPYRYGVVVVPANQERLKPQEEKIEEDRSKVDDLRGSPISVGNLEELIDENYVIVSSSVVLEYYIGILSFVDKDQ